MLNGLMIVNPNINGLVNIGDYVQALAARQYFKNISICLDRDKDFALYQGEDVKIIMNGWYMDNPENFPPSEKIHPLYIAVHINSYGLPAMLRPECVEYFKKHQPIGCRDKHTVRLLESKGVEAYFSGCLTLTLGRKYKFDGERKGIYIVEPTFSTYDLSKRPLLIMKSLIYLLFNFASIKKIAQKKGDCSVRSLLHNAIYFKEYAKVFERQILLDAEYISQCNEDYARMTIDERLASAENLKKKYAKAKLVITSRIHCALPCLGLETPVIYTLKDNDLKMSTERFEGLVDLFNTVTWRGDSLVKLGSKITLCNIPRNKESWRTIAHALIEKCEKFAK